MAINLHYISLIALVQKPYVYTHTVLSTVFLLSVNSTVYFSFTLFAFPSQIIELKFEKFDLERDNYCRYDHVAVYNGGESSEAQRIGRFCGDSPPA